MMAFDITAQLAPIVWGMFGMLVISAAGIVVSAAAHAGSWTNRVRRPARAMHPVSLPASA